MVGQVFQQSDKNEPDSDLTGEVLVSFLILTQNRKRDLQDAIASILRQDYAPIEIVIVDNDSTDGTQQLIEENFSHHNINYIRLPENKGVCGGRNVAIQAAKGQILITMDDDAVIEDRWATTRILQEMRDPSLGVLAFKVVAYSTGQLDRTMFPTRDKSNSSNNSFEIATFIGVGHAIPKQVYQDVGLYNDYFPYGHEEIDLALRILDAGYRLRYYPNVTIRHKGSEGRKRRIRGLQAVLLENRIKVAIRNLPWKCVLSTSAVWSVKTIIDCRGNPLPLLKAWWNLWKRRRTLMAERSPIRQETFNYIRSLHGPLYY